MTKEQNNQPNKTFDDIKQLTHCVQKCNIFPHIPEDVYTEINEYLRWPEVLKPHKNKMINTKVSVKNIKSQYTAEMFMLEEKVFVLSEEVRNIVKISFKLSFACPESQKRFCLFCNEYVSDNLQKFYDHIRCPKHVNCFQDMRENQEFLTRAKQFIKKISEKYLKCYVCNVQLNNSKKASQKHIKDKYHKQVCLELRKHSDYQCSYLLKELDNCWYNVQIYACIPCNKIFQSRFNFLQHLGKHNNKKDIVYDFCTPCTTLWIVDKDKVEYSYSIHCNYIIHKYLVKNQDFAIKEIPKHVNDLLNHAEDDSEKLYKSSEVIFQNDVMQERLLQSLKSLLTPLFPAVKIYPFGSRLTGLGFPNSDIDIFLDCNGNSYEQNDLSPLIYKYLDITEQCLSKNKDEWVVQEIIKQTRTPIIKLRHRLTGLQCDISFTNGLSVENTNLIRYFNKACLPCRKLILFVKRWLSFCSLPGRHSITNYALTWFVIFYLQKNEGLPSIDTLIKQKNKSRLIAGWETGVDYKISTVSIDKPFKRLLLGFFDFYSDFNYKNHVACPLIGDVVRKQDFINTFNLPIAMNPYIKYLQKSQNSEKFRIDSSLCIQDPFDLSHNLTKAVQPLTLKAFKQYCKYSADILRDISNH